MLPDGSCLFDLRFHDTRVAGLESKLGIVAFDYEKDCGERKNGLTGKKGKILKIKMSVNPNSSSVGADIIYLTLFTGLTTILTFTITGAIRLFRRGKEHVQE